MVVLLTGKPHVGKSTLIKKILTEGFLSRAKGFTTKEITDAGRRVAFKMVNLRDDSEEHIIAKKSRFEESKHKVGDYGVYPELIGQFIKKIEIDRGDIAIIDEVGKMQDFSKDFRFFVKNTIAKSKLCIATIAYEDEDFAFAKELKLNDDYILLELTENNRDLLYYVVLKLAQKHFIYNEFSEFNKKNFNKFIKKIVQENNSIDKILNLIDEYIFFVR